MQDNNTTPPATPETTPPVSPTPDESTNSATDTAPVAPETPDTAEPVAAATTDTSSAPVSAAPIAGATAVPGAKNHLLAVLLSVFVGGFGVDRFYLGHIGLGVAKLLLSWLTFGIWWLVDVILVATRKVKNVTWED